MNIQVYCKDGIYSSVISQHIGVLDARIRGRLKNKYCKFCGMWSSVVCWKHFQVVDELDGYSIMKIYAAGSPETTQFSYLAMGTGYYSCSCLVWFIDGMVVHMTLPRNWAAYRSHSVICGGRWILVLSCLSIKKLLKNRKRYVQNIEVRQGLMSSGFLLWDGSVCVKYKTVLSPCSL